MSAAKEEPHVVVEHMRTEEASWSEFDRISRRNSSLMLETASPWLIGVHR